MAIEYNNVDEYISTAPDELQPVLHKLRALIRETVPNAQERISYGMPGYYLKKPVVYFAYAKAHIGLYPTPSPIVAFAEELRGYKTSKGAIQFPASAELPWDLIRRIVIFRVAELEGKE